MKSKLLVSVLCVLMVFVFMGFQDDGRGNDPGVEFPVIDLPAPPPPIPMEVIPGEGINKDGLSGIEATAGNVPSWVNCDGKYWVNYDFLSQSISQSNVDWPIMIIFYGNATVNKVKNIYGGTTIASTMNGAYNIGSGTQWDTDMGTKLSVTFGGPDGNDSDTLHLRIYAPPGTDYFDGNAGSWGHYVIASAHFDFNPPWDSICGYSEDCEHKALQIAANQGYSVIYDYIYISNYESLRNASNHWWQSDGYVSLVYVP
jgi:hypothetical protein